MLRSAITILTAIVFAIPLAAAVGDKERLPEPGAPPNAAELRAQVRDWQRSRQTAWELSPHPKFVRVESPRSKVPSERRLDLPDGCYFFSAKSVAACQRMTPTIERLRQQGFRIVKVDIGAKTDLANHYAIKSIPAILIKQGANVVKLTGVQEEPSLYAILLKYHLQDEVLRGGKGKDRDAMVLLAYQVPALATWWESLDGGAPQPDLGALVHMIQAVVEPESWDEAGGSGKIVPIDKTQTLVVRQTPRVHAQIRIALDELRKLKIEAANEKR